MDLILLAVSTVPACLDLVPTRSSLASSLEAPNTAVRDGNHACMHEYIVPDHMSTSFLTTWREYGVTNYTYDHDTYLDSL